MHYFQFNINLRGRSPVADVLVFEQTAHGMGRGGQWRHGLVSGRTYELVHAEPTKIKNHCRRTTLRERVIKSW